ncbi:MAG TPA: [Fe-Fe] hydrogenase large subunit C-terminal domain-containing protein [Bacillota bacterium]|nr:[Fe-Fe] hydrogenase large subunit C-terminal domain-containing protein [Bacillota bacterium]
MSEYIHSVSLDVEKCKGCTNCLKRCPTEAISVRDGHAEIDASRCIDCGECIRICPYKAKKAVYDKLENVRQTSKWLIALPAPSLYGQFDNLGDIDYIIQGLRDIGFDDVYEVSAAAEIVSAYTRRFLKRTDIKKPVISSACPVVVRLITQRYPFLCGNIMPMLPPVEIAAMNAKERALKRHPELKEEDICACFISPCPAKVGYVKNKRNSDRSYVDAVVSVGDVYFKLLDVMNKAKMPPPVSNTGIIGIGWASTGGEATALFNDKYLAADGIENVIKVLEEIDNDNFTGLEFIELNACSGGCVGGVMTVENPYIAQARLQMLKRYLPVSQNWVRSEGETDDGYIPDKYFIKNNIEYDPTAYLDSDRNEAMKKMKKIEKLNETLPALDCGFCGAPTCRAFAEDVVRSGVSVDDCVIHVREMVKKYNEEHKSTGENK